MKHAIYLNRQNRVLLNPDPDPESYETESGLLIINAKEDEIRGLDKRGHSNNLDKGAKTIKRCFVAIDSDPFFVTQDVNTSYAKKSGLKYQPAGVQKSTIQIPIESLKKDDLVWVRGGKGIWEKMCSQETSAFFTEGKQFAYLMMDDIDFVQPPGEARRPFGDKIAVQAIPNPKYVDKEIILSDKYLVYGSFKVVTAVNATNRKGLKVGDIVVTKGVHSYHQNSGTFRHDMMIKEDDIEMLNPGIKMVEDVDAAWEKIDKFLFTYDATYAPSAEHIKEAEFNARVNEAAENAQKNYKAQDKNFRFK